MIQKDYNLGNPWRDDSSSQHLKNFLPLYFPLFSLSHAAEYLKVGLREYTEADGRSQKLTVSRVFLAAGS